MHHKHHNLGRVATRLFALIARTSIAIDLDHDTYHGLGVPGLLIDLDIAVEDAAAAEGFGSPGAMLDTIAQRTSERWVHENLSMVDNFIRNEPEGDTAT